MYKATPKVVLLICIIGSIVLAILKYTSPGLFFSNSGVILIIVLTTFLYRHRYTYLFSATGILIVLSKIIFNVERPANETLVAQLPAVGIILLTTLVVIYIKQLNRKLAYDRRQMNAMFEYATEGIILTNSKGEIVLANPEATKLFMYQKEELIGRPIEILIPPRIHTSHKEMRQEYYQNPSNRLMAHGRDLYALKKNGVEFPVEVCLSHYTQKKDFYVLVFITDISARKEAESRLITQKEQLEKVTSDVKKLNIELENKVGERTLILQEALQELEKSQMELSDALSKEKELNEIKSRFVSMASHEFRTPLSTVLSSAALLARYTLTEDQDKREKHIRRIKESVKHLNDLLEDFLNLGKLEEGRVFTQVVRFNVKDQVQDVIDEIRGMLKTGQEMVLDFEGSEFFITDNRLLKNILLNLLSNAIKFSEEGKQIHIAIQNFSNKMELQVKDEGIGISTEDMQHLFSTFYRGRNAVNIQGTGLGLHIVKRYVNLLKGDIMLTSELNEGTTVNIALPGLGQPQETGQEQGHALREGKG
jgi:PAS domain S-box-containing protein